MKKAIVIIIALILLTLLPSPASAQSGIKVWPTKVELTVNKGEQAGKTINVQNQGSETIRVRAYVMDFSIDTDGNFIFSEPGYESYSASKWLSIGKADFELAPAESQQVEVSILVPSKVEPGGHFTALFFETVPLSNQDVISISARIPTLFYITIPGVTETDIFANAEITSLLLPGIAEKGPVETGVVVRNSGNVHLTVAAKAYFSTSWGRSELDLGQIIVLPNSSEVIKSDWRESPFFDRIKVSVVIGYFNQQGELVNKTQKGEFWVVPWKLFIFTGVALGLIGLGAVLISKKFRLRVERKR